MSTWTLERSGHVATLTFTRPPGNLMDFASMIELADHLDALAVDARASTVVVLASGHDDVFIDHSELTDLARAGQGEATEQELDSWARGLHLLEAIPQPTVAAVDGLASSASSAG